MLSKLIKMFTSQNKESSKSQAKKRLQFALIYDKLEINDNTLKDLQNDIIQVISRYFEIDRDALSLEIQRGEETSALVFNTPILQIKRR
ncbi:MAG: cell division topological specificity factor MinE [Desulfobacteraceae bacterium]|nr:cell division topological specificity factor MinE [Desulfobacteraceae bacterium]